MPRGANVKNSLGTRGNLAPSGVRIGRGKRTEKIEKGAYRRSVRTRDRLVKL